MGYFRHYMSVVDAEDLCGAPPDFWNILMRILPVSLIIWEMGMTAGISLVLLSLNSLKACTVYVAACVYILQELMCCWDITEVSQELFHFFFCRSHWEALHYAWLTCWCENTVQVNSAHHASSPHHTGSSQDQLLHPHCMWVLAHTVLGLYIDTLTEDHCIWMTQMYKIVLKYLFKMSPVLFLFFLEKCGYLNKFPASTLF